jgi:hypothetical protein
MSLDRDRALVMLEINMALLTERWKYGHRRAAENAE